MLPQDVDYPAAVYQRIAATRPSAFNRDVVPVEAMIQVDVYSRRIVGYDQLNALGESVRTVLQRVSSQGTPPVYDVYIDSERDEYEDDTDLFRKSFDLRIWYEEA